MHNCNFRFKTVKSGYYIASLVDKDDPNSTPQITWCKLTVSQAPLDISIKFPENLTVKKGEKLKLSCLLSRKPTASALKTRIKMLKDNKPLELSVYVINEPVEVKTESRNRLIDNMDRQLTFQIEQSELDDTGKFTLVLDDTLKTSCHVKVIPSEEKKLSAGTSPKIITDLDTNLSEHLTTEPFNIFFIVENGNDSDENLKVEWFHNEKKLVPLLNQLEKVKLENGTFKIILNFNTPFVFDSGKYHCKIANQHGQISSQLADILIKDPNAVNINDIEDESLFQTKPRFVEYFSDVYMEADQGAEAQFKCKIIGKPEPKVVWFCNCHKINAQDAKFELIKSDDGDNYYTLIVKNVSMNDEGEYTCKASNCKGETSWSANLYLNENLGAKSPKQIIIGDGKENMVAPNFLRKIRDSTVGEGGIACFDCFVDGTPFPTIKWFKNNAPLDIDKGKLYLYLYQFW
jgi:hypothetical protein